MAKVEQFAPLWDIKDIINKINIDYNKLEWAIEQSFAKIGEDICNDARDNGSYEDDTSNLRHSIGYNVWNNGKSR